MKYRLKTLAKRPAGSFVALPEIQPTLRTEKEYLAALRRLLKVIRQHTLEEILPMAIREMKAYRAQTRDATTDWDRFTLLSTAMARAVSEAVNKVLALQAKEHTSQWFKAVKKALGVDVSAIVTEEDLVDLMEQAAIRNASLITNISQSMTNRIQQTVQQAILTGSPVSELKARLVEDFKFGDKRAQLIARDQVSKLNSDLNRFRHQEAGCNKYTWRTSLDERVRSRHKKLNGKVYAYGEATGAEQGLPPGQPIRCRCIAIAIVEF